MKKILVLSIDVDYKNSLSEKIKPYYEELTKIGVKQGVQFYRTSVFEYNTDEKYFNTVQKFDGNSWVQEDFFTPDLIWYKSNTINYLTRVIEEEFPFINSTKFIELANNKLITSIAFQDYSPKTSILNSESLELFKSNEVVVIKPDWWSGGEGVEKIIVSEITSEKLENSKWYIIQELIDSSEWIEWVVEGIHDIRFFIYGDRLWDTALIRTPPKWDFRCNVSQWWSSKNVTLDSFPIELIKSIQSILKKIKNDFWMIYWSIDMTKSNWKYYLVEFNSSPWVIMHKLYSKESDEYHEEIVVFFKNFSQ